MTERTLKETYELHKKSQYEKVLKFMDSVSVTENGIFSDPKKILQISESIEVMEKIAEIAKPLVPSLQLFLNKNSIQLNEGYKKENLNNLKQTLYRYAALSEFFKQLPTILKEERDLYVSFKDSVAGSLLLEEDFENVANELGMLPKTKLLHFASVFPKVPLILGQKELNEAVKFLYENTNVLKEQNIPNLTAMLQAVNALNTLIKSLDFDPNIPNEQELPNVKKGLQDLVTMIQQVTANAKTGLFGASEEKVIAQVRTAMSMLQQLADKWDAISQIMDNQLKIIEKRSEKELEVGGLEKNPEVQKAIALVKNAIIRNISVAGSGGFFSNLLRRYKGQNIYPKTLTPQIVANDVISLLSKEFSKPAQEAEKTKTTPAGQVTEQRKIVLESIDDLKNVLNKLGGALKQLKPAAKTAVDQVDQTAKTIPSVMGASLPSQPTGQTVTQPGSSTSTEEQPTGQQTTSSNVPSTPVANIPTSNPLEKPVLPPTKQVTKITPEDLKKVFTDENDLKKILNMSRELRIIASNEEEKDIIINFLKGSR